MAANRIARNENELAVIRAIAESGGDGPVTMLNMNRYTVEAGYPDGDLYQQYMAALDRLLPNVGAKILWRTPVHGQAVGEQPLHEILAAWYPSHRAFLDLPNAEGASENFRLRNLSVAFAVIHRCPGDKSPLSPN